MMNAQDEIISKLSNADAAVRNEALLQNNEDILKAELINTDQQLIEIRSSKDAALHMLEEFLDKKIDAKTLFILPQHDFIATSTENIRPEMKLFDLQMNRLDATKKLSTSKLLPKISVFGQAGYGRPGLNMLDPDFKDWYFVGAKVSWNVWNWNLSKNEKKIADIQKEIIVSQKETFDKNIRITEQKDLSDIRKYDDLIKKDEEIVALRKKIAGTTSVQLDDGVITATEYTTELNALTQSQMNLQLHKIQRQMAILSYLYNSGKN
jgi:outer membrane protein TolC